MTPRRGQMNDNHAGCPQGNMNWSCSMFRYGPEPCALLLRATQAPSSMTWVKKMACTVGLLCMCLWWQLLQTLRAP